MVDCNDEVQVFKAFGVARIAWMDQGTLPPEMEARFPRLKGEAINLQQDEGYVDLLIGADNSRWMPAYVGSSEFPFDNLRLMMSSFGERFILMGSPGKQTGASPGVDDESNWQNGTATHPAVAQERIRTQQGRGALQLLLHGAHGGLQ